MGVGAEAGTEELELPLEDHIQLGHGADGLLHAAVELQKLLRADVLHLDDPLELLPLGIEDVGQGGLLQGHGLDDVGNGLEAGVSLWVITGIPIIIPTFQKQMGAAECLRSITEYDRKPFLLPAGQGDHGKQKIPYFIYWGI